MQEPETEGLLEQVQAVPSREHVRIYRVAKMHRMPGP